MGLPCTRMQLQRRHGLYLSHAHVFLQERHAAGALLEYDLLGDRLCNTGNNNTRHHNATRAWRNALAAVSNNPVILGDKDPKCRAKFDTYNKGHVPDMVEPGGGPGGTDRLFETKVFSPCCPSGRSQGTGAAPASVGHAYACGSTAEPAEIQVLGLRQRGRPDDPLHSHTTGEGFVASRPGDYADAILRRRRVVLLLHEVFGGLEARAEHFLYELADLAARPGARDSTRYTRCARGFVQYHIQRISLGIIQGGAIGMRDELQKLRRAHAPRAA